MKLSILMVLCLSIGYGQQQNPDNPISSQFEKLIESSNNFKEYKVVKQTELSILRKNTDNYIKDLNLTIRDLEKQISSEKQAQANIQGELTAALNDNKELTSEKDSISILGFLLDKSIYNILMWTIVGILSAVLILLYLQFKKSKVVMDKSKIDLATAEDELELLRRKSIEKEQRLGRQLQDERNKLSRLKTAN